ncbi:MAG TPA: adenylate kinase [Spirochaetaceae bacterium]|nr:adenylate kinase [Spirochaetaceae bacterium]
MKMVFLGPPGAGKGTLAAMASKNMGLPHISTGDLFRAAIKNETDLGKKVKGILAEGKLVPDDLTIALVKERLGAEDALHGWILDGFPRTTGQAEALQSIAPVELVVNFDVPDETVLFRLTGRSICKDCGQIYHASTMPPAKEGVCDKCGGLLYIRSDDREEAIKTRLNAYREQTQPLIAWYSQLGKLVTIDGSGSPDAVYTRFSEATRV